MKALQLPSLPDGLLAGVSGGADSVALLRLLLDDGVQVTAVHVNHGLRGEASDGDECFVRGLCAAWHVPLLVYRADPPVDPGEDWARQARYGFFRQAAEDTGIHTIALAHHRDDQAETLLLHLLRGAGLTGLQGMAADTTVNGLRILRPLLGFSRAELRDMLEGIGQPWREDGSNADTRYLRNALRHDVLPRLEALIPGASARIARTAELLQGDEAALEDMTRAFLERHAAGSHLPLRALREQPEALQRRILRRWWQEVTGGTGGERSLSAMHTGRLLSLIDGPASARCGLPGDWTAQGGWTHLHLIKLPKPTPIREETLAESALIRVEEAGVRMGDGRRTQAVPADMLEGLVVRSRRAGDWIRPFGSSGRQSLQDYFVNRHVDEAFRDLVPLVCRGSEVLLAGGVGAGAIPRMTDKDERVLLTWMQEFPWHATDEGGFST